MWRKVWFLTVSVAVSACGSPPPSDVAVVPTPSPRASEPSPTPSQSVPPLPKGAPDTIFALSDSSLVELDARDGSVIRTILPKVEDVFLDALSLSPDRKTAYLSRYGIEGPSNVISVSLGDESVDGITNGSTPHLSPDGAQIQFERPSDSGVRMVVRHLRSGEEREWHWEQEGIGAIYFGGWLPDSNRFFIGSIGADPPGSVSGIIDMREGGETIDLSGVGPGPDERGFWWEFAVPRTSDAFVGAGKLGTGGDSPTRLDVADAASLERISVLLTTRRDFFELDFDATGRHMVGIGSPYTGRRHAPPLVRWHGDELVPLPLAPDVDEAVW